MKTDDVATESHCVTAAMALLLVVGTATHALGQAPSPGDGPWAGYMQCTLTATAATYQEEQTHTWQIVPGDQLPFEQWPAMWTVQGVGSRRVPSGGTLITENWTIEVPQTNAPIRISRHPGTGQVEIYSQHGLLVAQGAIDVVSSTGQRSAYSLQEWGFPRVAGPTASPAISGTRTRKMTNGNGWRKPPEVWTIETCTWNFARGTPAETSSIAPLPPPRATVAIGRPPSVELSGAPQQLPAVGPASASGTIALPPPNTDRARAPRPQPTEPATASPAVANQGGSALSNVTPGRGSTLRAAEPVGPAPTGLTAVAETPAIARLNWQPPVSATPTGYNVYRALAPSGTPSKLNATPITDTRFWDNTGGIESRSNYRYRVEAIFPDGGRGQTEVLFQPSAPQNPAPQSVKVTLQGTDVVVSWAPVPGASRYGVAGATETMWREVPAPATSVTYPNLPNGAYTFAVGAYFDPGAVSTPASEWPKGTIQFSRGVPGPFLGVSTGSSSSGSGTQSGPAGSSGGSGQSSASGSTAACACAKTGAFGALSFHGITNRGQTGTLIHPTAGPFTVSASATSNPAIVDLAVTDSSGAAALSVSGAAAWGVSPDRRFFVVIASPLAANAGSPAQVYRIAKTHFPTVVTTEVWPDGAWGFSPDSSVFIVTRQQQAPNRFGFEAHNLTAANPATAVLRLSDENDAYGHLITVSPCGDRLMHFRWTQILPAGPQAGQADFFARKDFGRAQSIVIADADVPAVVPPGAAIEAGAAANTFNVRLSGARVRATGQTTFQSLQCQAP